MSAQRLPYEEQYQLTSEEEESEEPSEVSEEEQPDELSERLMMTRVIVDRLFRSTKQMAKYSRQSEHTA